MSDFVSEVLSLGMACFATQDVVIPSSATGQSSPAGVAVSGGYVYWANSGNGKIMRARACQGTPAEVYGSGTNPITLVTDGASLFWNDFAGNAVGVTAP